MLHCIDKRQTFFALRCCKALHAIHLCKAATMVHAYMSHVVCHQMFKCADVHGRITGSGGGSAPSSSQAAPAKQASTGINESQPATTLQIRLADGSKLTGRFNSTQTVQDVKK